MNGGKRDERIQGYKQHFFVSSNAGYSSINRMGERRVFRQGKSFSDGTENIPDIVTDSALSGESSERDYELSIETGTDVELTESDFYDPEFRVEKYVKVRNSGKKENKSTGRCFWS